MCARLRAVERLAQQYTQSRITQIDGCTRKYSGALSCTHERNIGYLRSCGIRMCHVIAFSCFYALLWHENCGNSVVSEYVPCHATAKTVNVHDCAHIWTAAYMHVGADNKRALVRSQNPDGGGYEIRTREAVTPTRFPSVRHRPLGESSMHCSAC